MTKTEYFDRNVAVKKLIEITKMCGHNNAGKLNRSESVQAAKEFAKNIIPISIDIKDYFISLFTDAAVTGCIAISDYRKDEKDRDRVYIRRERYAGACSRSFYVGENVKQEDIKACFEDGTLKLQVPKNSKEVVVENPNYITIEG